MIDYAHVAAAILAAVLLIAAAGIVTDGDLRRSMTPDLLNRTAGSVMTHAPKTIDPDALASEALAQLNQLKITSLFVIDGERRPVGLIHIHDLLRIGLV